MNASTAAAGSQVCPVCQVTIVNNTVIFSSGTPGTRARLYARVCQYAKNPACINQDPALIGQILTEDGYKEGKDIDLSSESS